MLPILCANGVSFLVICISSIIVLYAADFDVQAYAAIVLVCLCAQGVWLTQHLWFYHRDHLRLGWYEMLHAPRMQSARLRGGRLQFA